jgi:hypothetical protein
MQILICIGLDIRRSSAEVIERFIGGGDEGICAVS